MTTKKKAIERLLESFDKIGIDIGDIEVDDYSVTVNFLYCYDMTDHVRAVSPYDLGVDTHIDETIFTIE